MSRRFERPIARVATDAGNPCEVAAGCRPIAREVNSHLCRSSTSAIVWRIQSCAAVVSTRAR